MTFERVRLNEAARWVGVGLALLLVTPAASIATAGDAYRITPSGYRVPVLGTFVATDGSGITTCRRLSAPEISARDHDRLVRARSNEASPRAVVRATSSSAVSFVVVYADRAGTGFSDPTLGATRRAALSSALSAWSRVLVGPAPITVEASFASGGDDSELLASAAPTDFVSQSGLLVPFALASQRAGSPVNRGGADLTIEFGSDVDWDYVPDGVIARNKFSFVYTAIHEIGHGLGFIDTFDPDTGDVSNGLPTTYDVYVNRGTRAGRLLVTRDPDDVVEDLVSDDLYFAGPNAIQASQVSIRPLPMVKLYAPDPYEYGSSVSHLDQVTYENVLTGLMVPYDFGPDYAYIDRLALAIMADVGYVTNPAAIPATPGQ
jgi:hypothetical protein